MHSEKLQIEHYPTLQRPDLTNLNNIVFKYVESYFSLLI